MKPSYLILLFSLLPFKIRCWTFDLPAMPLGRLGRMSLCLGPVSMIIPLSFVMHGRRVFDVHFFQSLLHKNNLALMGQGDSVLFLTVTLTGS